MYVYLLLVDKILWCAITEQPFIPKRVDDVVKHPKHWDDVKTKKASYYLKVRSLLIYTLSAKVFNSISHHTSAKGMWDALQSLYEGTNDVKGYKIIMFTNEFELFC